MLKDARMEIPFRDEGQGGIIYFVLTFIRV